MLVVGFEPTRYYYQQILSLPRLPIPSYQHIVRNYLTHNYLRLRIVDWSRFPLASSPPGICSPKYFSAAPTTAPFVQPGALCWPQNLVYLVRQTGIEPVTYRLKGDYSTNWVTGVYLVEPVRIELTTFCLQSRRSTNWTMTPYGAANRTWTCNTRITNPLHYQLCYSSIWRQEWGSNPRTIIGLTV